MLLCFRLSRKPGDQSKGGAPTTVTGRSDVTIRPALAEDAPAIAEIWHLGWRDGHLGYVPDELTTARTEDSFHTRAAQRVSDTTVAVIDGRIAGFVMVVGDEVEQVYVSGLHRGAGVADVLLNEAERQVKDAGHSTAWLAVVAGNARARRFYERHGWVDEGLFEYSAGSEEGPITVPSHRYVKDL
jgi:GNAT superfamily N-acetyltransferase